MPAYLPVKRDGPSCEEATSKKARVRVCRYGADTWGDSILESNITRRVDFALFLVAALENDELVHQTPAIVSCKSPSALAHAS